MNLSFGNPPRLSLLDPSGAFSVLPTGDPHLKAWVAGDISHREALEVIAAKDADRPWSRFVIILHRAAMGEVVVVNDRYGQLPLFVHRSGDEITLATRALAILEARIVERRMDRDALADALAFSVPFARRTLVAGVETYPAGTLLTVDLETGRSSERRYWDPSALFRASPRRFEDAKDELYDAFLEGFDSAASGRNVGITLSGGIDSRCFLAVAEARRLRVTSFNCSLPGSRSAAYAQRMARLCDSPYHQFPVGEDFAASYEMRLRSVVEMSEGMSFSSEVECHWLRERIRGVDIVLHGAFAELSKLDSMHLYFLDAKAAAATRASLFDVLWDRFSGPLERFLAPFVASLRTEIRERARANLARRLDQIDRGLPVEEALQVLYIEEFLLKVGKISALVWNDAIPTRFPFAYPRYVDALLRVRSKDRIRQTFRCYF